MGVYAVLYAHTVLLVTQVWYILLDSDIGINVNQGNFSGCQKHKTCTGSREITWYGSAVPDMYLLCNLQTSFPRRSPAPLSFWYSYIYYSQSPMQGVSSLSDPPCVLYTISPSPSFPPPPRPLLHRRLDGIDGRAMEGGRGGRAAVKWSLQDTEKRRRRRSRTRTFLGNV